MESVEDSLFSSVGCQTETWADDKIIKFIPYRCEHPLDDEELNAIKDAFKLTDLEESPGSQIC